jgi:hypothetical protein
LVNSDRSALPFPERPVEAFLRLEQRRRLPDDGTAGNDYETIKAGNGNDIVFAGTNDTIAVGNGQFRVVGMRGIQVGMNNLEKPGIESGFFWRPNVTRCWRPPTGSSSPFYTGRCHRKRSI